MASPEGPRIQLLLCSLQIAVKKIKMEGSALLVYSEQINTSSCTSKSARPGRKSESSWKNESWGRQGRPLPKYAKPP